MRFKSIIAFLFVLFLVLCGYGAYAQEEDLLKAPESAVVDKTEYALINWTDEYIEAVGQAVAPPNAVTKGQAKLLAKRGAIVDLQRNLLEVIKGVRVDARTTMENFLANDYVRTEVRGTIKNVRIVKALWNEKEGIYTVIGRIPLTKLRKAVLPALPVKPSTKPAPKPVKGNYTGLVVDVRHLPLIPAMTFRILDENGKEVYSLKFVDKERFLSSGLCEYQINLNYALGRPRVTNKPLVVKAIKLVPPQNVDIVIPNSYANKIRNNKYDFRVPCRVIVVKR